MSSIEDQLTELFEGEDAYLFEPKQKKQLPTADDRLIESFEEVNRFFSEHGRAPSEQAKDFKEAMLGARLTGILGNQEKLETLSSHDRHGILALEEAPESLEELFESDNEMFDSDIFDVSKLPEKRVVTNPFQAARREASKDFKVKYEHLFKDQQKQLASGERRLTPFFEVSQIQPDNFYVYDGLMCYVVKFGEKERKAGGYSQQRLLVIFENGTESKMYRRSLAQRLYEGGSVVIDSGASEEIPQDETEAVGYVYVLRSLSTDPKVATIRDLFKIGVTNGSVPERIKGAENDPTYLMAPVEVVDSYKLTGNYNPQKVEAMIHNFFADAKVVLTIIDQNGYDYVPQEWYSVPRAVINEAVDLIDSGKIKHYIYDRNSKSIINAR